MSFDQKEISVLKKDNIFIKIKNLLKKLLLEKQVEKKPQEILEQKEINKEADIFNERLKYIDKYEWEKTMNKKLDRNEIGIEELTIIEKQKMIDYYKKEIYTKQKKLKELKKSSNN